MVSFVSCFKQLVLVWLLAKESDFMAGKVPLWAKKERAVRESKQLDVKPGRDYLIVPCKRPITVRCLDGHLLSGGSIIL